MTDEQNIVYVQGIILQARIELEAMLAENEKRKMQGYAQAYGEEEIRAIIEKHGIHHNALVTNLYGH